MSAEMLHALVASLAPGVIVVLVIIVAATVPMWVPVVTRAWPTLLGRLRRGVREGERAFEQYRHRTRQRADFEAQIERHAWEAGLAEDHYPGLIEHMGMYWDRYSRGQVSLHLAVCECYAWINRRTTRRITHRQGATS